MAEDITKTKLDPRSTYKHPDEVLAEVNVDPRRVLLSGFSNGGTGALLYATLQPDRFAAVASLMGAGSLFFEASEPLRLANLRRLPEAETYFKRLQAIAIAARAPQVETATAIALGRISSTAG